MSIPENPKPKDLQQAARRASMNVYGDPANFDRFAPSPLQTMDSRYRNISSFLPSGEITPYAMNYQELQVLSTQTIPMHRPMQGWTFNNLLQAALAGGTGGGQPPGDDGTGSSETTQLILIKRFSLKVITKI